MNMLIILEYQSIRYSFSTIFLSSKVLWFTYTGLVKNPHCSCFFILFFMWKSSIWKAYIDGQVRLVRLQMDNFRLFLHQQTDKRQLLLARWANSKRIKENYLGFRFPFSIQCLHVTMPHYGSHLENRKVRHLCRCCTDAATDQYRQERVGGRSRRPPPRQQAPRIGDPHWQHEPTESQANARRMPMLALSGRVVDNSLLLFHQGNMGPQGSSPPGNPCIQVLICQRQYSTAVQTSHPETEGKKGWLVLGLATRRAEKEQQKVMTKGLAVSSHQSAHSIESTGLLPVTDSQAVAKAGLKQGSHRLVLFSVH